jgi:hypothetical protein
MDQMTTRERFQAIMDFKPVDRLPLVEWAGWWGLTIDRWHTESLPADLVDRYDICRHFGLDVYLQGYLGAMAEGCPGPKRHGAGIVENMDDYEQILPYLYPDNCIDAEEWKRWAKMQQQGDVALWFTVVGYFWYPRTLFGIEPHFYAFYDQPELMHRMNRDCAEWTIRTVDKLCEICTPDFMTFAEDMSYNHGPMLSKKTFDEFLAPYYEMVIPHLHDHGIMVIVDTDGDITVPAAWYEDVGADGMLPLERQAGVDVAQVRKEHPEMRFVGCFDKMTMNQGEAAMRGEFERLLPTAKQGGLIISCDHQTPPGVSYDDFQLYLRLFREYGAMV